MRANPFMPGRRRLVMACCCLALGVGRASLAALPVGSPAPNFTISAALGGEVSEFALRNVLKQGPVVLYFFPAAFTSGCTIEAHEFAEATDEYQKYGATVLGVSADDINTLKDFSLSACRSKFAVGADPKAEVIGAYDARMAYRPDRADRISYVISPDGKIYYEFSSRNPDGHVQNTMEAVKRCAADIRCSGTASK
jgi:peroxiredoxin Q/BCP